MRRKNPIKANSMDTPTIWLPAPTRPLLWYAVRGWAYKNKVKPRKHHRTPEVKIWLSAFIRIQAKANWLEIMAEWAYQGAINDNAPLETLNCIERSFQKPNMAERIIREMGECCQRQSL